MSNGLGGADSGFDESEWARQAPQARAAAPAERIAISASASGRVRVSVSRLAAEALGFRAGEDCDVLQGTGARVGQVMIIKRQGGAFRFSKGVSGSLGVIGWKPDWAPDFAIKAAPCRFEKRGLAVVVELPEWFDRELQREIERREGSPHPTLRVSPLPPAGEGDSDTRPPASSARQALTPGVCK